MPLDKEDAWENIQKDAEAQNKRYNSFDASVKERSGRNLTEIQKLYEQKKLNNKQAIYDMAFLYHAMVDDDAELSDITSKMMQYGSMNVNAQDTYWTEGNIYREVSDRLYAKLKELQEMEKEIHGESMNSFMKNGKWIKDEEIEADKDLKEKSVELSEKMTAVENKTAICNDLLLCVEAQRNGRLALVDKTGRAINDEKIKAEAEKAADKREFFYIDSTEMTFEREPGPAGPVEMDASAMPLFPHEPNANDVRQGMLGDCFYVSCLSNMARLYPEEIKDNMVDNLDNTVTVKLYSKQPDDSYKDVFVRVKKVIPTYGDIEHVEGGRNCLWVNCYERALIASGLWSSYQNCDSYKPMLLNEKERQKIYGEIIEKKKNGEYDGESIAFLNDRSQYPWFFKNKEIIKYPSYKSIVSGYPGPAQELLLGPKFKNYKVNIPKYNDNIEGNKVSYSDEELKFYQKIKIGERNNLLMNVGSLSGNRITHIKGNHSYSLIGARMDEESGRIMLKLRNPIGEREGFSDENGLVTTFKSDGSRSYEWTHVQDGFFEIELKDFEKDFYVCNINGYDRVIEDTKKNWNNNGTNEQYGISEKNVLSSGEDFTDYLCGIMYSDMHNGEQLQGHYKDNISQAKALYSGEDAVMDTYLQNVYKKVEGVFGNYLNNDKSNYTGSARDFQKAIDLVIKNLPVINNLARQKCNSNFGEEEAGKSAALQDKYFQALNRSLYEFRKELDNKDFLLDNFSAGSNFINSLQRALDFVENDNNKKVMLIPEAIKNQANPVRLVSITRENNKTWINIEENGVTAKKSIDDIIDKYSHPEIKDIQPDKSIKIDETIGYDTFISYYMAIDKACKDILETDNTHSDDSPEYTALKKKLFESRGAFAKLQGKPFEELQKVMDDLGGKMYAYEAHVQEKPKMGKRRHDRIRVVDSLKKVVVNAYNKSAVAEKDIPENADYVLCSEHAKMVKAGKEFEKSIDKRIEEVFNRIKIEAKGTGAEKAENLLQSYAEIISMTILKKKIKTAEENPQFMSVEDIKRKMQKKDFSGLKSEIQEILSNNRVSLEKIDVRDALKIAQAAKNKVSIKNENNVILNPEKNNTENGLEASQKDKIDKNETIKTDNIGQDIVIG